MKEVMFTYDEAVDLLKISESEIVELEGTIKDLVDKRNKWLSIQGKMKSFIDGARSTDDEFKTWLSEKL